MNKKALVAAIATLSLALSAVATLPAAATPSATPTASATPDRSIQPVPMPTATATVAPTRSKLKVAIARPSNPTQPVVLRVSGVAPGGKVEAHATLARMVGSGIDVVSTSGVADTNGRATLTLRPSGGGWVTNDRYALLVNGQVRTPVGDNSEWQGWEGEFTVVGKVTSPAPKESIKPSKKPAKTPAVNDRTRGLAKTGF